MDRNVDGYCKDEVEADVELLPHKIITARQCKDSEGDSMTVQMCQRKSPKDATFYVLSLKMSSALVRDCGQHQSD